MADPEDVEEVLAEIDDGEKAVFDEFFLKFDKTKKGYVAATQLGQILDAMEVDFDDQVLKKILKRFDPEGTGKLDLDVFCCTVYTVANSVDKETVEKELRDAFRLFDKAQLGYISRDTMKGLLHDIDENLSDAELDAAIDEIDEDGSGKIEFEEFFELMAGE